MWGSIQDWLKERIAPKIDELEIESTGVNATFRHQAHCAKPKRPCACMPFYKTETGLAREFWVTPHPNRRMRRQAAMAVKRGWL